MNSRRSTIALLSVTMLALASATTKTASAGSHEASTNTGSNSLDISGEYHFRLCEPVQDERLYFLAVKNYGSVAVKKTSNALDICEFAFDVNWKIENQMHAKICVLDDARVEPLVRIEKVLSTRKMPQDPHDIAVESALKESFPKVNKISFQGELIVLENNDGKVCLALEKIKKEQDTEDSN